MKEKLWIATPVTIQFILIILRINGSISCSWVWVLSPLWVPIALPTMLWVIIIVTKIIKNGSK